MTKSKRSGAWNRRAKRERDALAASVGLDPNLVAPAKPGPKRRRPARGRVAQVSRWLGEPGRENLQLPQEPKHRALALLSNPSRAWLRRKSSLRIVEALSAPMQRLIRLASSFGRRLGLNIGNSARKRSSATRHASKPSCGAPHEISVGNRRARASIPAVIRCDGWQFDLRSSESYHVL